MSLSNRSTTVFPATLSMVPKIPTDKMVLKRSPRKMKEKAVTHRYTLAAMACGEKGKRHQNWKQCFAAAPTTTTATTCTVKDNSKSNITISSSKKKIRNNFELTESTALVLETITAARQTNKKEQFVFRSMCLLLQRIRFLEIT